MEQNLNSLCGKRKQFICVDGDLYKAENSLQSRKGKNKKCLVSVAASKVCIIPVLYSYRL